jgi:hypothetical protein
LALIGATGGHSLARALPHGYHLALIVLAGLGAVTALISARFVADRSSAGEPTMTD